MQIANSTLELVGQTPLVRLNRMAAHVKATIACKLEFLNPGGSVKDRPAMQIIQDAEEQGLLKEGGTIIEATSGNTGMGLAMVAAMRGYKTIFVMPDKMSEEKVQALRAVGAKVVITPTAVEPEDPRSYYSVARRLVDETPHAFYANQYHNPSNPHAHYLTTGPEIWEQTDGKLDAFITTMGTGGTISGTAKYLKEKNPKIKVIGIDPLGSLYYDYFRTGKLTQAYTYLVEGFGEDFLPGTMDFEHVDDMIRVTDKECFVATRDLVRREGIFAGGSSGAAAAGSIKYAERYPDQELLIVTIMCDSYTRYLSKIFNDIWMQENGFLDDEVPLGTVRDLLESKGGPQKLIMAKPTESARDVIHRMKENDVSQLPVVEADGRLSGMISESDMLSYLLKSEARPDDPIEPLVKPGFSVVEPINSVALLGPIFTRGQIVLVLEGQKPTGIITKIDYIDYVSSRINR